MEFKLNISDPKTGKTYKRELKEDDCRPLIGKKVGDVVSGDAIGFAGYEFKITGGSDYCGFPMRRDVEGNMRKKILLTAGVGIRNNIRGMRLRKTVAGNQVHAKTAQLNLSIQKEGKEALAAATEESAPKEAEA